MFKFLKDKISGWAKGLSEKAKLVETSEEVGETKKEKQVKKKSKEKKKISKDRESKVKKEKKEVVEKEITPPMKFNVALHKFEPDLEKINEIVEKEKKEKKSFFGRIKERVTKAKISEEDFVNYSDDLEFLLLENNVALEVAEKIVDELKDKIVGKEILKKEIEKEIKENFKEILEEVLIEPFDILEKIKEKGEKPYVILFCGINGSGKTTTIAKIADYLKNKNFSSVLAAGDTFRAASIEQIKKHGEKLRVNVIAHEYGSDPASVGFDAVVYAKKKNINVVLIDTAGRMHTAKNLLNEMEKIVRVCKPDLKIFIGESITGNDAIEQVRAFDEAIGIDGIILSKADVDEKGGTAVSVGYVTGKPILFLGTGQEYKDIEKFDKKKFVNKLGL
jgi:fused signal recognition particle receptor